MSGGAARGDDPRVARWISQARDERIRAAIEAIYREAEAAVVRERPLCLASGRCCRFDRYGHDLFVTAIEAASFVVTMEASDPSAAPDGATAPGVPGAPEAREPPGRPDAPGAIRLQLVTASPAASSESANPDRPASPAEGAPDRVCPWLDGHLCGARAARPLGCRTFFCDPGAESWSGALHERLHRRLRELHDRFGIVYHYDEWLRMLALFGAAPTRGRGPR